MGEVAPLDFTESVAVSIDVSKPFPTISNPRNSKVIEYYLTGASVRGTQVLVDAAIWIAVGCLVAAIFRNWGPEQTRSVFGDQTRFGLLIGWLLGMLLPVCSLGVIPVVRELHRRASRPLPSGWERKTCLVLLRPLNRFAEVNLPHVETEICSRFVQLLF